MSDLGFIFIAGTLMGGIAFVFLVGAWIVYTLEQRSNGAPHK